MRSYKVKIIFEGRKQRTIEVHHVTSRSTARRKARVEGAALFPELGEIVEVNATYVGESALPALAPGVSALTPALALVTAGLVSAAKASTNGHA